VLKFLIFLIVLGGATLIVSACGKLRTLDAIMPADGASHKIAREMSFGPDPRQKLDIYAPKSLETKKPVIIFVYGGSWASGSRKEYGFAGRALAAQGFVVVIADYRLVPAVRFPAFIEDVAQTTRWVQDNIASHGGDADNLILMGHSAGAYNAMMAVLDTRYFDAAGVNTARIKAVIGLAGPYDFYPFDVPASVNAFGQAADPVQTQPITFAHADAPPILLLTGDTDTTVKPRNSKALAAKLKSLGAPVELKIYQKTGHIAILLSLSRPFRGRTSALADATAFARRETSGQ
jgi:acetyl esterase/lipase